MARLLFGIFKLQTFESSDLQKFQIVTSSKYKCIVLGDIFICGFFYKTSLNNVILFLIFIFVLIIYYEFHTTFLFFVKRIIILFFNNIFLNAIQYIHIPKVI